MAEKAKFKKPPSIMPRDRFPKRKSIVGKSVQSQKANFLTIDTLLIV
jgi:hypothetical protein